MTILLILLISSWQDIAVRKIPDSLNAAVAVFGLFWIFILPTDAWAWFIVRAMLLFICLIPLCGSGFLGGGDVKLMSALALGLSWNEFWDFLWFTAITGGLLGLVYLVGRKHGNFSFSTPPRRRIGRIWRLERRRIRNGGPLPYGVAISLGWSLAVLPTRFG